ncbi:MAG TPA: cupin domain-containing protein [Methylocella sp.]|nr:cupin domain-containing protein [Methylocella sp.]
MQKRVYHQRLAALLLMGSLLFAAQNAGAESGTVKFPQDITFQPTPAGVQVAVLYGDPSKPGLYVVRFKLPAGTKVIPHTHPEQNRTLTVLSGTLYFGLGDRYDETKLTPYPAGTFFSEVPNVAHYVAAKDGDVIFQATGIGPTELIPAHHAE